MNKSRFLTSVVFLVAVFGAEREASAQLFDRLRALANRVPVGDSGTEAELGIEGPKAIAAADLDGDGTLDYAVSNSDGTVTILWGDPDPDPEKVVGERIHLQTGAVSLRGLIIADLDGNTFPDIIAGAPFNGSVMIFFNDGTRSGFELVPLAAWAGARDMVAEDFDGDGDLDLVVGGNGVGLRLYRNDGTGNFEPTQTFPELDPSFDPGPYSAKPVFSLKTFHPVDGAPPVLVATHADSDFVHVYQADAGGSLVLIQTLTDPITFARNLHDIALAPMLSPASTGVPDLIGSSKIWNTVGIWRGTATAPYFLPAPAAQISIARAPRASAAADRDGDGWNDLVVVQREGDAALVLTNNRDTTFTHEETAVLGASPRDLVTPDFDGDGTPDIVATNRASNDVSFVSSARANAPQTLATRTYPTDGEPAGLGVADLDGDGRDDVVQLHRASGDVSVRLSGPGGALAEPLFYPMGRLPSQMSLADLDADGTLDVSTANLGDASSGGAFALRYGAGDGTFGPLLTFPIRDDEPAGPNARSGGIFAIVNADFDGDGIEDQAVGYYDCRVGFFRGLPDGTYEALGVHEFASEARVMVVGDFDQDGDIDLAGAGNTGQFVVFENEGDLLTADAPKRHDFFLSGGAKSGVKSAVLGDANGDGDPDVIIGTSQGAFLVLGGEGITFHPLPSPVAGRSAASSLADGDFDNDGDSDLAIACDADSTLAIFTPDIGGNFAPALESVPVPSAKFIAGGDIDGDGLADLAGTGSVLWVALSGPAGEAPPPASKLARPRLPHPVINEILAINNAIPIPSDENKQVDVVEIFNGAGSPADLSGWTLRLEIPERDGGPAETKDFLFPPGTVMPGGGRQLVYCSKSFRSAFHTGFKLPGDGATLRLLDAGSAEIDRVEYPAQTAAVSYGRYGDAIASFSFNPFPDPGAPNLDNGGVEPEFELQTLDALAVARGEPVRFYAEARDDVGIVSLTIVYKRLDVAGAAPVRVPLFDDGNHGDGARLDGLFSGVMHGLPEGAQIEFYIEAIDLTDQVRIRPDNSAFSVPGLPVRNYSLAVGASGPQLAPGVEISEVLGSNSRGIVDGSGNFEDWIELRNTSPEPADISGLELVQDLFRDSEHYLFPEGTVLAPGAYLIVWADNAPEEGPMHAPFRMDADGDETYLVGKTELGATAIVSSLVNPPLGPDRSYARLGSGHLFAESAPTPGAPNLTTSIVPLYDRGSGGGAPSITLLFPTVAGATYAVESSADCSLWTTIETVSGNGAEQAHTFGAPPGHRYFRVKQL